MRNVLTRTSCSPLPRLHNLRIVRFESQCGGFEAADFVCPHSGSVLAVRVACLFFGARSKCQRGGGAPLHHAWMRSRRAAVCFRPDMLRRSRRTLEAATKSLASANFSPHFWLLFPRLFVGLLSDNCNLSSRRVFQSILPLHWMPTFR